MTSDAEKRARASDAAIYAGSAVVAGGVWLFARIPIQRTWGRTALGPYVAGAIVVVLLGLRRSLSVRARAGIALAVLVGVALLPMSLEIAWRARTSPGLHAQSEAIVTEEAAHALVHGKDPYAVDYLHGPLSARPLGTKTHFPYLPAMLAFGLPRAVTGPGPLGDARIAFAAATILLAGWAAWSTRPKDAHRTLTLLQVMLVLPTSALLMATGGDDLPVLGLMLLAVVLASRGKAAGAGLAAGLAGAMKQTAWPLVPFLVLTARDPSGRRAWRAASLAAGAVVVPLILPFVVWSPGAFVEDVVKFPLGMGRQRSAADAPTLGAWLVRTFPEARVGITAAIVILLLGMGLWLLLRIRFATPAGACERTGLLLLAAIVLTPAGRIAYLLYPVNLLAWSRLLGSPVPTESPSTARYPLRHG